MRQRALQACLRDRIEQVHGSDPPSGDSGDIDPSHAGGRRESGRLHLSGEPACCPAKTRPVPIAETVTPTVRTSQKSTLEPVTASKLRRFRIGQIPVVSCLPCSTPLRADVFATIRPPAALHVG
jgi:hypothetical protein